MLEEIRHAVDIALAERVVEGCERSFRSLQDRFDSILRAFLRSTGAMESEIQEILTSLWTDCAVGHSTRQARLLSYRGQAPLMVWLKTVVMNELIDMRRRAKRMTPLGEGEQALGAGSNDDESGLGGTSSPKMRDTLLLDIMRDALREAVSKCPAETLVMLQLVFLNDLTQREVARMWGWSDAKVSRALHHAMDLISKETLRGVKQADEWIELQWEDILEISQYAEFPIFS